MSSYDDNLAEKAALTCFPSDVKESYVRMMLLVVLPVIERNKKMSINKLFSVVRNLVPVTDVKELLPVVMALDTPFKCVTVNSYRRTNDRTGRPITEVTFTGSDVWDSWVESTLSAYPEMRIWLERSHGTTV